jgi:ribbon-helix-helix CopG family protein
VPAFAFDRSYPARAAHRCGVKWCILDSSVLPVQKKQKTSLNPKTTRASVSFPAPVYAELERLAAAKKVSLAWVVREAAERYVEDQCSLFKEQRREGGP